MRAFERNIHDGDDLRKQCDDMARAVHAVISNTLWFDMAEFDEHPELPEGVE